MRVFLKIATAFFIFGLLVSSLAFSDTHCKFVHQINSKGFFNTNYSSIKEVTFNKKYSPINIEIDGISLNETLLAPHDPSDREEVSSRSLYYIEVKNDASGMPKKLEMTNDWDTYEIKAHFMDVDHEDGNHFGGVMQIAWDDQFTLFLDCHR